jgi:hypothetical protein
MTSGRVFKVVCVVLYAGIVGACFLYTYLRTTPHTMAARKIEKDQLIGAADIVSSDQKDIAGHNARRAFTIGETITAKDVSPAPDPSAESTAAIGKSAVTEAPSPIRKSHPRKR